MCVFFGGGWGGGAVRGSTRTSTDTSQAAISCPSSSVSLYKLQGWQQHQNGMKLVGSSSNFHCPFLAIADGPRAGWTADPCGGQSAEPCSQHCLSAIKLKEESVLCNTENEEVVS